MASKNIKGITIEINGNTTKLSDSLKKMNDIIYKSNSELKTLNNALKLDPNNVKLLSQKHEELKKNISATTDKLNQLKETQKQMGSYKNLTDAQKESYRTLTVEIVKSKDALKNMKSELKECSVINLSKVKDSLKSVGEVAGQVISKVGTVVSTVGAAISAVVATGVKSYADLEQNIGGVETLFKDSADKVKENAAKAYETAGLSANEYMETVTSFSASLLQSLGGDTSKAADVADMALKDMADNANKFGTDMSSIQYAYQGFAKQNYTMLDNLKLGYGGTKTEMQRLLTDAQKLTGIKYDISNLNDVYSAIHIIQEEMGVTGTTALEASTTVNGSLSSMKAAFDNFVNGSGSPEQLSNAVITFINNVANVVLNLAPNILSGITTLIKNIVPKIATLIVEILPQLFSAAQELIASLLKLVQENTQPIADTVISLFNSLIQFILENLPMIVETALELVLALALGISENIDELIPAVVDVILKICDILIDNLDSIIDAAFKLLLGIASGIIKSIPSIVAKIPVLIKKVLQALTNSISPVINIGVDLVKGLWSGISKSFDWIKNKIKSWVGDVLKFIKKLFGINSPAKTTEEDGKFLAQGLGVGFTKEMPNIIDEVDSAMRGLSTKVSASVNPVINPTTNSNPLIIQIENFNNTRNTDIQALSEELEFYRRNAAAAKGSV